jgi:hypothetical protein
VCTNNVGKDLGSCLTSKVFCSLGTSAKGDAVGDSVDFSISTRRGRGEFDCPEGVVEGGLFILFSIGIVGGFLSVVLCASSAIGGVGLVGSIEFVCWQLVRLVFDSQGMQYLLASSTLIFKSPSLSTQVPLSRCLGSQALLLMVMVLSSSSSGLSLCLNAVEETLLLQEQLPVLGPGRSTSGVGG